MLAAGNVTLDLNTLDAPLGNHRPLTRLYKPQVGRFVILHQLGAGGMGAVFAAYDEMLDRKVALKLLHHHSHADSAQRERALREAKALARVTHPNVVTVYDVGESDGQAYLAMEFVDGRTLRAWQSSEEHSWNDILGMYLLAGAGLCAAHRAGIVHRDFKPDNILVGNDGLPRVVDFGIAHVDEPVEKQPEQIPTDRFDTNSNTNTNTIAGAVGTIGYMSPEQLEGAPVDTSADQWSYCASLYQALYGSLPFAGSTVAEQISSVRGTLRTPSATDVPPEIFRILRKGLAHDPAARFPSLQAMLDELGAEHHQSAAAAASSRRVFLAVFALGCLSVWGLLQYLLTRGTRIVSYALILSMGLVTTTLVAGYFHRATLRRNSFHRAMWALFLVTFVQNMFIRGICSFYGSLPAQIEVAIEMSVWTGTCLMMSLTLIRRMWWVTLVPLAASAFAILSQAPTRRLLLCGYPLVVGLVLWQWRKAANDRNGSVS